MPKRTNTVRPEDCNYNDLEQSENEGHTDVDIEKLDTEHGDTSFLDRINHLFFVPSYILIKPWCYLIRLLEEKINQQIILANRSTDFSSQIRAPRAK